MEIAELITSLQPLMPAHTLEALKQQLSAKIAYLIHHDFERLLRVLYTVDVDESVLKQCLQQQPQRPAADIITDLIIERQLQKIRYRQQSKEDATATDEERW